MSVILRLGAVNTDTPYSRLISDGAEYDQPLDMTSPGPNDDDQYHSPPQTYPGCFGLPYQDHNYGAPPPPSPPRSPPPVKLSTSPLDINEEVVVTSDTPTPPPPSPPVVPQKLPQPLPQPTPPKPQPQPKPKLRHLDEQVDDSITRCICDFIHDDGYMICCDRCSVWQHIVCMGLDRDSIPDTYLCEMCEPRPVDHVTARDIQIRKREFLKTLIEHDNSETDTDPEEITNRMRADGLSPTKKQQKMKLKKRKERMNLKQTKKKMKLLKKEKENNNREMNKRPKLILKNFPMKAAKKEKQLNKKVATPEIQNENAQDPWDDPPQNEALDLSFDKWDVNKDIWATSNSSWSPSLNTFNSWDDNYEVARYNHYSTYVQEYLNSIYINGHHNDIADLVTDGLRVQRCQVKELKSKRKALQATSPIPNGQPIIEVIGKVMTKQQYDKDNFGQRELSPFVFFYGPVFELDLVVDATDYGNDARFIRRSCLPNAIVRHVVAGGQAHFIAVATKEILETSEITIPYDYDYKKWNFCVDCACLRNNCPVRRFQKRMLKFKKQLQIGSVREPKKEKKLKSPEGSPIKSPVRSPIKSPIRSPIHSPYKSPIQSPIHSPIQQSPVKTPEKMEISPVVPRTPEQEPLSPLIPPTPSPPKMVRRSQVHKQHSKQSLKKPRRNSIQGRRKSMSALETSTRVRSLRVPSHPVDVVSTEQEPITAPEPASMRSSETDPLTSPELPKESATPVKPQEPTPASTATTTTQQPTEKRKLTREERKMEAIMKAFEKMEKRQERKNSALTQKPDMKKLHGDEPKKTPVKEKKQNQQAEKKKQQQIELQQQQQQLERQQQQEGTEQEEEENEKKVQEETEEESEREEEAVEVKTEEAVKEEESPVKTEQSPVKVKQEPEDHVEKVETKPPPVETKILSPLMKPPEPRPKPDEELTVVPVEEEAKVEPELVEEVKEEQEEVKEEIKVQEEQPKPRPVRETRAKGKKARRAAARRRTRLSTSAAVAPEIPPASVEDSSSMPLPHPSASCPGTPQTELVSPPSFRFLKTKRHLMNEWLNEKSDKPGKTDPLEVAVDHDDSMFVTCLPSPRNSMDRLRRNSQSNGGRPLVQSQSSAGSAKKRWLRQAMDEGSSDTGGMVSPVPGPSSGGMSPNPLACMQSPGEPSSVDFVTPLKKRRLARESLSLDSVTSESPTPNPSSTQPSRSYFMTESGGDDKQDSFKMKNGFKAFFSPLRPDSIEEDSALRCSSNNPENAEQCSSASVRDSIESDLSDSCVGEARPQGLSESEVEKVTDSEADSSVCVKTGKNLAPCEEGSEISESDVKTSESNEINSNVESVHKTLHQKSANSEPDSSDSVCRYVDLPMEVECDSLSVNSGDKRQSEGTVSNEVDSTETDSNRRDISVMESAVSSQQENVAMDSNCDSCVRERADSYTEDNRLSSSSLTVNSHPCTSSSSPFRHNICDSQKHTPEKPCVDSSTDQGNQRNLGNFDVSDSTENDMGNSVTHTLGGSVNSDINSTNDVGATENVHTEFYLSDSSEVRNRTDSMLMESGNYLLPSRYFNGMNGISADMTVDSTTHLANTAMGLTNNSIINSSGFSSLSSLSTYDSDSMDVTSASDAYQGIYDRRQAEDSLMGMMEIGPGNEVELPIPPKEKKKVSLQEYRKRVKDKPATTSTSTSVSSTATGSSCTVTSSSKTPTKLDKLPSLPSLPMFETQRKEFKSSSDLLSPIFNRNEKQEEITRTMSLSERLRQEFGLDDSTDDDEHKADQTSDNDQGVPPPPPPPPPPPQQSQVRTTASSTNSSIPSLMSLKTFPTSGLKTGTQAISSGASASGLGSLAGSLTKPGLVGLTSQTKVPSMPALASKILGDFSTTTSSGPGGGKPSLSSKILCDLGALLGKARSAAASMAQTQPPLGKLPVSAPMPSMVPPPPPGKSSATAKASALSSGLGKINPPLINPLSSKVTVSAPTGIPPVPSKGIVSGLPPPATKGAPMGFPPPPPGKVLPGVPPPPPGKMPTGIPPPGKIPTGVAPQPGKVLTGIPPPPGKGVNGGPAPSGKAAAAVDSSVQQKVTKLAAQLAAALKAANGQAALGGLVAGTVTSSASSGTDQNGPVLSNGHGSSSGAPQVFDYGHKSGVQFKRQNSAPNNPSSAQTQFQHTNKASPPIGSQGPSKFHGFNKLSPSLGKLSPSLGNKLSPSLGNHNGHAKNMHGLPPGQFTGNSTSPSAGVHSQQYSSQHQSHNSHRKNLSRSNKFSKQHSTGHSHKYS